MTKGQVVNRAWASRTIRSSVSAAVIKITKGDARRGTALAGLAPCSRVRRPGPRSVVWLAAPTKESVGAAVGTEADAVSEEELISSRIALGLIIKAVVCEQ